MLDERTQQLLDSLAATAGQDKLRYLITLMSIYGPKGMGPKEAIHKEARKLMYG